MNNEEYGISLFGMTAKWNDDDIKENITPLL